MGNRSRKSKFLWFLGRTGLACVLTWMVMAVSGSGPQPAIAGSNDWTTLDLHVSREEVKRIERVLAEAEDAVEQLNLTTGLEVTDSVPRDPWQAAQADATR